MEISLIRIVNMCQKEENGVVWHIKTITDEAYKNIILPMSELKKEITLRKRGIATIVLRKKTIQMMEAKTLLDEFYDKKCSRYF